MDDHRLKNISQIKRFVAAPLGELFFRSVLLKVTKSINRSRKSDICLASLGQCSYYCDTSHAICGHPDNTEGSLAAFLPSKVDPQLKSHSLKFFRNIF